MIFRRIIFNAVFIGILTGLLVSGVQMTGLTSIIYESEAYEVEAASGHDHGTHDHSEEAWSPEDGTERITYTFVSNILAAIGFAAVVLALMSQLQLQGITKLTVTKGLLWGLAGFTAFFLAPGIGLSPEIPGTQAAVLEQRQIWWVLTVACMAIGLAILAFTPMKYKALGLISIALPYIIGAPHLDGPKFTHPDPAAVEALTGLHHQFVIASGISNLVFWLALGAACAWVLNKWVLNAETSLSAT